MLGGTLALLNHSLQLGGRLLRHHLYRLAFVGILYLFVVFVTLQSLMVGAPGQWLFSWIAYLNFWFITLAGVSFFATAISEEKEEETLGILRMAGVGPSALLLGKSTSRLIVAGLLLALQFPFTLLSITLGGVTGQQVVAVFLGLLAYTALVANLALCCSVVARTASRASVMMTVLLGLFLFGPPLVKSMLGALPGVVQQSSGLTESGSVSGSTSGSAADVLMQATDGLIDMSVFARLSAIMATGFDESPFSFQVGGNLAAALLLFVLSRLLFDRVTRYHAAPPASRGLLIRPRGRLKFLGTGRVWKHPLIWKDFHFVTGGKPLLLLKFAGYTLMTAAVAVLALIHEPANPFISMSIWTIVPMSAMLLIESTVSASRLFRDEVQLGSLSSLMLLPTSPHAIAYAKVAGCLLGLIPALVCLGAGLAFAALAVIAESSSDPAAMLFSLFFVALGGFTGLSWALFFVHLVAYLSLVVKWGAIPMAIAISIVSLMLFSCILGLVASMAFLGGAVLLHILIGSRLKQLGTEG